MWGPPVAVIWNEEVVGHFEARHGDDDFPRMNGRWTAADTSWGQEFLALLLQRGTYPLTSPPRVRLGDIPGVDCLVNSLWVEPPAADGSSRYRIVLSLAGPPRAG